MRGEIHLGDIGTGFQVQIKDQNGAVVDVSLASNIQFTFNKPTGPNNTSMVKSGLILTDGKDGWVQYITQAGDLDVIGDWRLQVTVVLPYGTFHSDVNKFKVYANI